MNAKLTPASAGAVEAAALQGGANATHRSDPQFDTADFADTAPGTCTPTTCCPARRCSSSTPASSGRCSADPLFRLTGEFNFALWGPVGGFPTSDHRSVWIDVTVPATK